MRFLFFLLIATSTLSAQQIRAVAGEAPRGNTPPIKLILSASTSPDLAFPLQAWIDQSNELRITIPPATPPGEYTVEVQALAKEGILRIVRYVTVEPIRLQRSALGSVPVVLLNGWQITCPPNPESTVAASTGTFGQMAALLQQDGASVSFFNNCVYRTGQNIPTNEALAEQLRTYLDNLRYTDGSPVEQVDLIAHSMGGLIVRAYLAGMRASGPGFTFVPAATHRIRKLVTIATPHWGSFQASKFPSPQTNQMVPGNPFLWQLNTWNQNADDLRGVDALAVIGNGGYNPNAGRHDGVVSLTSASLGFAQPGQRTRIVRYCHITPALFTSLGMDCDAYRGIADIDNAAHLTARIVRSFLADTPEWTTVGQTPAQDPVLSQFGGLYFSVSASAGSLLQDLTGVTAGATALATGTAGTTFYHDFIGGSSTLRATSSSRGALDCGDFAPIAGRYQAVTCKPSLAISGVSPLRTDTSGKVVASGASITIHGRGFGTQQCAGCSVEASQAGSAAMPLSVSAWADQTITALLPGSFTGAVTIVVRTPSGSDSIGIAALQNPPASAPSISSVLNGASLFAGIQSNSWVAIKGLGLSPTTRAWDPARDFAGNHLPTSLDGVTVTINGRPAFVYYISSTQINVLAPVDTASGAVQIMVTNANGPSRPFSADLQSSSPAFFTFDGRYLAAVNLQGAYLGPPGLFGSAVTTVPAKPGETILLFGTGCGPTSPAVPADVIFSGAAALTSSSSVTIGGQTATVTFSGMSGNGLCQFNVVVPLLSAGDHAVVATIGGRQTQTGVVIAVAP